ncbi:MAG: zf-TFIIB domain-containing protein [Candidatus Eremiobacteraeota bacterium]|nr:zf-TFIIB domain-containing protein [Candidatus Eremiobacteraeota bacterium]
MPLYDYQCPKCHKVTEIRHGFNDVQTDACPSCGGALTRVFNPAPILFKGSGFYVTDSRKSSEGAKPSTTPSDPGSSAPAASAPTTTPAGGSKESAA